MSAGIYVARNNQQSGPFGEDQLSQMIAGNMLAAGDLVWHQGMSEWKSASDVFPGLFRSGQPSGGNTGTLGGATSPVVSPKISPLLVGGVLVSMLAIAGGSIGWYLSNQSKETPPNSSFSQGAAAPGTPAAAPGMQPAPVMQQQVGAPPVQAGASGIQGAQPQAYVQAPPPAAPAPCPNCGVVESIDIVTLKGEGTGVGAVGGALAGGAIGNQIGHGGGRGAATALGLVGGAIAGHEAEKSARSYSVYRMVVRMENGTVRKKDYRSQPAYRIGDQVVFQNGEFVTRQF